MMQQKVKDVKILILASSGLLTLTHGRCRGQFLFFSPR